MILRRIVSGAILIPVVSIPAYYGGLLYFLFVLVVAAIAAYEYDRLMRHGGYRTERLWGFTLILLILADAAFPERGIMHGILPLFVMLTLAVPLLWRDLSGALVHWALTLAGALYVGALLAQVIVLRQLEFGLWLTAMAAFTTWANDTAAYFVGTRFGKRRFAPRISPKKSWEGAIGGGLAGMAAGTLTGYLALPAIPLYHIVILSLLIVVAGVIGDLAESLIKRQVVLKILNQPSPDFCATAHYRWPPGGVPSTHLDAQGG